MPMLEQLTKVTRRKFYNKWLYKVTIRLPGAGLLRIYNRDQVDQFCSAASCPNSTSYNNWKQRAWRNRHDIRDLLRLLDDSEIEWSKRIEGEQVDIYTNDKGLYDDLSDKFEILLIHRFEPDPNNLDILDERNGKTMTVKRLPHGRFNYRVYLLPHNLKDTESRVRFLDWLEEQKPRVTCSESVRKWFLSNNTNWDRRYILVEDDGTLMLMKLRNADVVGTVYKFEVVA
jgi:hypothetical protein